MDDEDDGYNTDMFISLNIETKFMRIIGNTFVPSNLNINCAIERNPESDDDTIEFVLNKWRYWVEQVVNKSIVFCKENSKALDILIDDEGLNKTGNIFVLTPADPSDELIAALLQSKFNALGNGHMIVSTIEITSDNIHGLSFTLMGDHAPYLPTTAEEYLGGKGYWEGPWWTRDDASTIDVLKPDNVEEGKYPGWAYSLDFLDRQAKKVGAIIGKNGFNPTIIKGGKDK
jgi:hypothetical protein